MTPTVLYAWELGGNLGHAGPFLPLGRRLKALGARVECALADTVAARLLAPADLPWVQAPVFRGRPPSGLNDPPVSYADMLLLLGYAEVSTLLGLAGGWRRLIELTGADLVLADHAPTAILAARTLGVPVMMCGTGFYTPPSHVAPCPAMRPWAAADPRSLAVSEARALATINGVLGAFGAAPLDHVAALFDVAEPALATFPELDPFPRGPGVRYWGAPPGLPAPAPDWPPGRGPRIYGYLRRGHAGTAAILAALRATACRAVVFCPDAGSEWAARKAAPHLHITAAPVDLAAAGREAELGVVYGSHAVTAGLLHAGLPLVLAPENLEQGLTAWRVQALGAGVMVGPRGRYQEAAPALAAILRSGEAKAAAMAFARRNAPLTPEACVEAMADRAMTLARANRSAS